MKDIQATRKKIFILLVTILLVSPVFVQAGRNMYGLSISNQNRHISVHEPSGCLYSFRSDNSPPNQVFCRTGDLSISQEPVIFEFDYIKARYGQIIENNHFAAVRDDGSQLSFKIYKNDSTVNPPRVFSQPISTTFVKSQSDVTDYDIDWLKLSNGNIIVILAAKDLYSV